MKQHNPEPGGHRRMPRCKQHSSERQTQPASPDHQHIKQK